MSQSFSRLFRDDRAPEPRAPCAAVRHAGRPIPNRIGEMARRFDLGAVMEQLPGRPAARPAPAPVAGGRHDPFARHPHPGRADLGRGPGGARRLLADPVRSFAQGRVTIFVSTHFMNEAELLRPRLLHACGQGAGQRQAGGHHGRPLRRDAGRRLHLLPGGGSRRAGSGRRSRSAGAGRASGGGRLAAPFPSTAPHSPTRNGKRWSCGATRSAPPSPSSAASS